MSDTTVENNVTDVVDELDMNTADMPTDEVAPAAPNPMALGVGDLNTMATVLDAAAQRGAIRANEMHVVGQLYTKLHSFLVENGLREAPGTATPEEGDAPEETIEENTDD